MQNRHGGPISKVEKEKKKQENASRPPARPPARSPVLQVPFFSYSQETNLPERERRTTKPPVQSSQLNSVDENKTTKKTFSRGPKVVNCVIQLLLNWKWKNGHTARWLASAGLSANLTAVPQHWVLGPHRAAHLHPWDSHHTAAATPTTIRHSWADVDIAPG